MEDLDDILSAPPPALGAPLRRAQKGHSDAPEAADAGKAAEGKPELQAQDSRLGARDAPAPATQPALQHDPLRVGPRTTAGTSTVRCSITRAASVSPKVSPRGRQGCAQGCAPERDNSGQPAPVQCTAQGEAGGEAGAEQLHHESDVEQASSMLGHILPSSSVTSAASGRGLTVVLPAGEAERAEGRPDSNGQAAEEKSSTAAAGSGALWVSMRVPGVGAYQSMTIAASLVGAVAGGAAAGPLGVSLGALFCA